MLKKAAFLALALVLAIGLGAVLSFPAAAEEPTFEVDGYQLAFDKASGTITECADASMGSPDLTIPAELDGVAVTGIGERAFSECESLENLTLPESVTWIGDEAFQGCASLRSVLMPGMVSIGPYAFASCGKMESISLPASLEQVRVGAFLNTPLTEVDFGGTPQQYHSIIPHYMTDMTGLSRSATVHYGDSAITWSWDAAASTLIISGTGYMNDSALEGHPWHSYRDDIRYVTIEPGVKSVGVRAFSNCSNLQEVTLSEELEYISEASFYKCRNLQEVSFLEGLECISEQSFYGCDSLKTISVPQSVTMIGSYAFSGCSKLELVMFFGSKEQWDAVDKTYGNDVLLDATILIGAGEIRWTFEEDTGTLTISGGGDMPNYGVNLAALPWYEVRDQIRCVIIEDGICNIGRRAFLGCVELETVVMAESVQTIGMAAFSDCCSLRDCTLSSSLRTIEEKAFYRCTSLSEAAIPDSVINLGVSAYSDCAALTSIHFSERLTTIPDHAFSGCTELMALTVPEWVTEIGEGAFESCSKLALVTLPAELAIIQDWTAFDHCAENLTIRGYDRTAAQSLVREKGFRWETLGAMPITTVYILPESETRSREAVETELREAMRSHAKIVLADGSYFISESLIISDLCDLSIESEHPGRAELLCANGYEPVIDLQGSCFVDLSGLVMGHSVPVGIACGANGSVYCAGGGRDLKIVGCDLWGCGTIAVQLYSSRRVTVSDSILRDCEYNAVLTTYSEAVFSDCIISGNAKNNGYSGCVYADYLNPEPLRFQNCAFLNNYSNSLDDGAQDRSQVTYEDCTFHDNVWQGETPQHYGVCLGGVVWEAVEIGQDTYDLLLGKDHVFEDGSVLISGEGPIPSYSEYSLPWKGLEISGALTLTPGMTLELSKSAMPWIRGISFDGAGLRTDQSYQFVYAAYDENGKLTSVELKEITFDSSFTVPLPNGYGDDTHVQFLLLDSADTPQCASIGLTILP